MRWLDAHMPTQLLRDGVGLAATEGPRQDPNNRGAEQRAQAHAGSAAEETPATAG